MMQARHPASRNRIRLSTDILVVGAGGAGMYAALAAARAGAGVILADKNMIGRGGATVMAQMTVAAALAEQEPDTWEHHLADTLAAGRGAVRRERSPRCCAAPPPIGCARWTSGGWDGHVRRATSARSPRPGTGAGAAATSTS